MKIFADYHHSGAAQGQVLLLQHRLGHTLYFPGQSFVERIKPLFKQQGDWLSPLPNWLRDMGGVPGCVADDAPKHIIDYDEFMGIKWDAIFLSRYESQNIFKSLLQQHPEGKTIKVIGMTGNDNTVYDWEFVKNFMSTDELSYFMAPKDMNKVWYDQEIGQHYGREYIPIDNQSLRTVNSFVNCWPSFNQEWTWDHEFTGAHGRCPHCSSDRSGQQTKIVPYQIWLDAAHKLSSTHTFCEYGINGKEGMIPEYLLPKTYASGALTVHMKTYEGYGYSMLQSIACGRPVIVPRKFYKYRTANKFLIPNLTCFELEDWNADCLAETIRDVTSDLGQMQKYSTACYEAANGMLNWELEAHRVRKFLGKLI